MNLNLTKYFHFKLRNWKGIEIFNFLVLDNFVQKGFFISLISFFSSHKSFSFYSSPCILFIVSVFIYLFNLLSFRSITEDWEKEIKLFGDTKVLLDDQEDWDREIALSGYTKVLLDWKFRRICTIRKSKETNWKKKIVKIYFIKISNIFIFLFIIFYCQVFVWIFSDKQLKISQLNADNAWTLNRVQFTKSIIFTHVNNW